MTQPTTSTKTRKHSNGNDTADAADAIETLKTHAEDAVGDLKSATENVQEKASDLLEKIRDQITANPIETVAMALAVGYVARMIFRGPLATLVAIGAGGYLGVRLAK